MTADDLHPGTGYDLWYSRLVLQHNPPPVTLSILDRMFAGLAPRGLAVIHAPTYCIGYSFNIADYLAGKLGSEMEMHFTPQKPILAARLARWLLPGRHPRGAHRRKMGG